MLIVRQLKNGTRMIRVPKAFGNADFTDFFIICENPCCLEPSALSAFYSNLKIISLWLSMHSESILQPYREVGLFGYDLLGDLCIIGLCSIRPIKYAISFYAAYLYVIIHPRRLGCYAVLRDSYICFQKWEKRQSKYPPFPRLNAIRKTISSKVLPELPSFSRTRVIRQKNLGQ